MCRVSGDILLLDAGIQMMLATAGAFVSTEGWLEVEAHESDLRGSRGVAVAGFLMCFMGICNFRTTVISRPCLLTFLTSVISSIQHG